jgi:hypothetical protein
VSLAKAVCNGDLFELSAFIIDCGIDINTKYECDFTALHYACCYHKTDIVEYLIEQGAHINLKDTYGCTALHYACITGQLKVVELLTEKDIEINVQDAYGNTALHKASETGCIGIVELLIEKGIDINAQNNDGETALHRACEKSQIGIVEFFIEKDININVQNNNRETALNYACKNEYTDIVKLLIAQDANVISSDITYILSDIDNYIDLIISIIEQDTHLIENLDSLLSTIQECAKNLNDQTKKEEIEKLITHYRDLEKKSLSDITINNEYPNAGYILKRSIIHKNNKLLHNYLSAYDYKLNRIKHLHQHMKMINNDTKQFSPLKCYATNQYKYNSIHKRKRSENKREKREDYEPTAKYNKSDSIYNDPQENIRKLADYARMKNFTYIDTTLRHTYMAENNTFSDIDVVFTHKN